MCQELARSELEDLPDELLFRVGNTLLFKEVAGGLSPTSSRLHDLSRKPEMHAKLVLDSSLKNVTRSAAQHWTGRPFYREKIGVRPRELIEWKKPCLPPATTP